MDIHDAGAPGEAPQIAEAGPRRTARSPIDRGNHFAELAELARGLRETTASQTPAASSHAVTPRRPEGGR